jgi:hypothetical protein
MMLMPRLPCHLRLLLPGLKREKTLTFDVLLCRTAHHRHNRSQAQVTKRTNNVQRSRARAHNRHCFHRKSNRNILNRPRANRHITHLRPSWHRRHFPPFRALYQQPIQLQTSRNVCATAETQRQPSPPDSVRLLVLEKARIYQTLYPKKVTLNFLRGIFHNPFVCRAQSLCFDVQT